MSQCYYFFRINGANYITNDLQSLFSLAMKFYQRIYLSELYLPWSELSPTNQPEGPCCQWMTIPSGHFSYIAIEHGHRNSWFTHQTWWFSLIFHIVFCEFLSEGNHWNPWFLDALGVPHLRKPTWRTKIIHSPNSKVPLAPKAHPFTAELVDLDTHPFHLQRQKRIPYIVWPEPKVR